MTSDRYQLTMSLPNSLVEILRAFSERDDTPMSHIVAEALRREFIRRLATGEAGEVELGVPPPPATAWEAAFDEQVREGGGGETEE